MFNSTHTLVGFAIARTGLEKWVPYATATAVIASNLPDIDSVAGFWGTAAYLDHHRGITHSLIGVPVLSLLLSVIMYFFSGNFRRTYAVAVIAMATHPLLDYLNSYGLRPFLPWSNKWYYGDLVFIFDPYLDAALLLGLVVGSLWPNRVRFAAATSMFVALAYVGVRAELHEVAISQLDLLVTSSSRIEKWAALPTALDLGVWEGMVGSEFRARRFKVCAPACGRLDTDIGRRWYGQDPRWQAMSDLFDQAASTPSAAALLRFARFPVFLVENLGPESGYRVAISDFRFYRESTNTSLAAEITFDPAHRVVKDTLSFAGPMYRLPGEFSDLTLPLKGGTTNVD